MMALVLVTLLTLSTVSSLRYADKHFVAVNNNGTSADVRNSQLCYLKEPDFVFYVNKQINKMLSNQPVFKFIELKVTSKRQVQIRWIDRETLQPLNQIIDSISIAYGCADKNSPNNFLAYRKLISSKSVSRSSTSATKLAAIFLNLKKLFPCMTGKATGKTICRAFPHEEDGFTKGKALLQAAGIGRDSIFGKGTNTYGFAIQDCPLMFGYSGCVPNGFSKVIVCVLPSSSCFCA